MAGRTGVLSDDSASAAVSTARRRTMRRLRLLLCWVVGADRVRVSLRPLRGWRSHRRSGTCSAGTSGIARPRGQPFPSETISITASAPAGSPPRAGSSSSTGPASRRGSSSPPLLSPISARYRLPDAAGRVPLRDGGSSPLRRHRFRRRLFRHARKPARKATSQARSRLVSRPSSLRGWGRASRPELSHPASETRHSASRAPSSRPEAQGIQSWRSHARTSGF